MKQRKPLMMLLVVVGLALVYVGYVYASHNAGSIPSFYPGYTAGSTHVHTKHAIAAFVLAAAAFIGAWFMMGSKKAMPTSGTTTPPTQ